VALKKARHRSSARRSFIHLFGTRLTFQKRYYAPRFQCCASLRAATPNHAITAARVVSADKASPISTLTAVIDRVFWVAVLTPERRDPLSGPGERKAKEKEREWGAGCNGCATVTLRLL
jgi:hypothetical protein